MSARYLFFLFFLILFGCERNDGSQGKTYALFLQENAQQVDSLLLTMSLPEKIGQLILQRTDLGTMTSKDSLYHWVRNNQIGGVWLEDLSLGNYQNVLDSCNQLASVSLLNTTNQRVSLSNQFLDFPSFPSATTIGAIRSDSIQRALSRMLLQQYKELGINFACLPSINHPVRANGTYDYNCFEAQEKVAIRRSVALLDQMTDQRILAMANGFTDFYEMPLDTTTFLDSILLPYKHLAHKGLPAIWIDASVFQPDAIKELQTYFLKNYLFEKAAFNGLLVGEVTKDVSIEKLIHAGTDIFVVSDTAALTYHYLLQFVKEGLMSEKVLNAKVRKVLLAKAWLQNKDKDSSEDVPDLTSTVWEDHYPFLIRQLYEKSLTLAHNPKRILPFRDISKRHFHLLHVGPEKLKSFNQFFEKYANFSQQRFSLDKEQKVFSMPSSVRKNSTIVITLDATDLDTIKYADFVRTVNALVEKNEVVLVNFGNPVNLKYFDKAIALIQIYERKDWTEALAAQLLFGGVAAKGGLPLTLNEHLKYKRAKQTPVIRLKYTIPEEVGIAPEELVAIDAIARSAIFGGATPGCQVMVVKEGKVIYDKAIGHHTYDRKLEVETTHLYDLASITKVAATSMASMLLYEKGQFKVSDRLSKHLNFEGKSPLRNLKLEQLFLHRSGLQPNMPIAPYILYKDSADQDCNPYFCKVENEKYAIEIADSMYMNRLHLDSIWMNIYDLKPRRSRYQYSDVNYNLIQKIIETKTKKQLDEYVDALFYKPLNLRNCTFNPLNTFEPTACVPTQNDEKWRKQLLCGYVHDESAALHGGVGGNAGLFSNANDLAVLFQMLLNDGSYGGKQYLKKNTIDYFTQAQYGSSRALGFDKKSKKGLRACSDLASLATFGHTGFTGTCVWIDPEKELIYIFLANRIYPDVNNRLLFRNDIRERIHTVIYKSLDTYPQSHKSHPGANKNLSYHTN